MWHARERGEECTGFWWGYLRERGHLGVTGIDGDNIMMNLQEVRCGRMDLIELAQNRDGCWALVNAVMNLQAP